VVTKAIFGGQQFNSLFDLCSKMNFSLADVFVTPAEMHPCYAAAVQPQRIMVL
jgi:hypothetical protein